MKNIPITVRQSDALYDLNFTLTDRSDTPIDITGATVQLKVQKQHATSLKFTGSMTVVSGPAGTCKYNVQATDFDQVGEYFADIVVTSASQVITYGPISILALAKLPKT